jgi:hypothetical protein
MFVIDASSAQSVYKFMLEYIAMCKDREQNLIDQQYDSTQRDRHARHARVNLLREIFDDLNKAEMRVQ